MMLKTKFLSLSIDQDETVVEWIVSVVFIIFVIIVVLFAGPPDPPDYRSPSEKEKQEVIQHEN